MADKMRLRRPTSGSVQIQGDPGRPDSDAWGVLLTNLGTPDAPTAPALRRYLAEFLGDRRVVEAPRWLWWLILNGIILRTRPARSARLYQKVWTPQGSPLRAIAGRQAAAIRLKIEAPSGPTSGTPAVTPGRTPARLELAMRYGRPSIREGLEALRAAGCRRILVFPMYPQYCAATTGTTFDAVAEVLCTWRAVPELHFAGDYAEDPGYIAALAATVREHWAAHGAPDAESATADGYRLVLSYHGIPRRYARAGDPYPERCAATTARLRAALGLDDPRCLMTFQSRFGREPWLQPYTDHTLMELGREGVRRVDVLCPGFAADCLETLEEIAETGREQFLHAVPERARADCAFHYIPALNDRPDHIAALAALIEGMIPR